MTDKSLLGAVGEERMQCQHLALSRNPPFSWIAHGILVNVIVLSTVLYTIETEGSILRYSKIYQNICGSGNEERSKEYE